MADRQPYLLKAMESLETAKSEYGNGRYNSSANRSYYARLQAAIAALIKEGLSPFAADGRVRHEAVQSRFVGQRIHRRNRYSADLKDVMARNQEFRHMADYQEKSVSRSQAARALRRCETFVQAIIAREGDRT